MDHNNKDFADHNCPIKDYISQGVEIIDGIQTPRLHHNGSIVEALIKYSQKYPYHISNYVGEYGENPLYTEKYLMENPIIIDTEPWHSRTVGKESKNEDGTPKDDPLYGEQLIKSLYHGSEIGYQRTLPEPGITHMIITDDRQMLEDKMYEFIPAGTMCLNGGPYGTKQFCEEVHKGND